MNCETCEQLVVSALYGELDDDAAAEFEQALSDCPRCRAAFQELRATRSAMAQLPMAELSPRVRADILRAARLEADRLATRRSSAWGQLVAVFRLPVVRGATALVMLGIVAVVFDRIATPPDYRDGGVSTATEIARSDEAPSPSGSRVGAPGTMEAPEAGPPPSEPTVEAQTAAAAPEERAEEPAAEIVTEPAEHPEARAVADEQVGRRSGAVAVARESATTRNEASAVEDLVAAGPPVAAEPTRAQSPPAQSPPAQSPPAQSPPPESATARERSQPSGLRAERAPSPEPPMGEAPAAFDALEAESTGAALGGAPRPEETVEPSEAAWEEAESLRLAGRYRRAARAYETFADTARSDDPRIPHALYQAGACWMQAGRADDADRVLRRLVARYPGHARAREASALLERDAPSEPAAPSDHGAPARETLETPP